jgi:hypothetical protein
VFTIVIAPLAGTTSCDAAPPVVKAAAVAAFMDTTPLEELKVA